MKNKDTIKKPQDIFETDVLVIIDMQNDFITGALANPDAQAIVEPICDFIKDHNWYSIAMTRDTHEENYLETQEGKNLPIKHCIKDTNGWCVEERIQQAARDKVNLFQFINKPTFGFKDWIVPIVRNDKLDFYDTKSLPCIHKSRIVLVGTCTDICVVSNALILKAIYPEREIIVMKDLCAGTTKENHDAAIQTMKNCQVTIM